MPAHDRVRRDDGRHLVEDLPAQAFGLGCQPAALVVGQPETPSLELLLENAVLLEQIGDHVLLMSVHPPRNGQ